MCVTIELVIRVAKSSVGGEGGYQCGYLSNMSKSKCIKSKKNHEVVDTTVNYVQLYNTT